MTSSQLSLYFYRVQLTPAILCIGQATSYQLFTINLSPETPGPLRRRRRNVRTGPCPLEEDEENDTISLFFLFLR